MVAVAGSRSSSAAEVAGANAGSSMPSRSASSAPSPESPPEHVRIPSPRPRGRAPRTASAFASSSRSWTSSAHAAPASRTSARKTRCPPASARVWPAPAAAPTADAPTFSTATPIPASAHAASASHSAAPSPGSSTSSPTDRSSGSVARCASQSAVLTTVSFPDEIAVWRRSPRRVASALTTRLPLCEISPTCPGSTGFSASPQRAAREWSATSPSQLGPQTGKACRRAAARSSASSVAPDGGARVATADAGAATDAETRAPSRKPAAKTTAPPHPIAPASSIRPGTVGAGVAMTTASGADGRLASVGTHGKPWADARVGLTPHTSPPKPAVRRLTSVWLPYLSPWSVAPTTATVRGWSRRVRFTSVERALDAPPLERAGDDQALDLARALPDAVDAELPEEALGDVGPQVAPAAEHLDRAVGAAVGGLAHEQLRHRRLGVDDLRVGARVGQPRDLERQRPPRGGVGRAVGERERDALEVHDPPPALLAGERPRGRLVEQTPHRAHAARRDPDPLLGEPCALQLVAGADAANHVLVAHLHAGEADRRVPVRIGVRERRVLDDRDARERRVDQEQRRPLAPSIRDDDVDRRDVAGGDEPLLAVDHPAAVAPPCGGGDARRVRARVLLRHRVAVVTLAAERAPQPAVDLLGRARGEHVVGGRYVPRQRVGGAPELLLDQHPLELRPALAAVLARAQAPVELRGHGLGLDARHVLIGDLAALGLLLEREQDLLHEASCARLELGLLVLEGEAHTGTSASA